MKSGHFWSFPGVTGQNIHRPEYKPIRHIVALALGRVKTDTQLKLRKPTIAIGYSLRMCARQVDSTNPGRSNLVFRLKPIAEAEMSNRLISHSLRLILSNRYVEGRSRYVTGLLPFILCIYCIGSLSQLETLNCTVLRRIWLRHAFVAFRTLHWIAI